MKIFVEGLSCKTTLVVAKLPNVFLYDIDDLEAVVRENVMRVCC